MIWDQNEEWKDVVNYEGIYKISNMGRIKSLCKKWHGKEVILKPTPDRYGYLQILLYKNKKRKMFRIHTLVATAFIGISTLTVNHKDGNKMNNCFDNLEWVTSTQNSIHAMKNKLKKSYVTMLKSENEVLKFNSMKECSKFLGKSSKFIQSKLKSNNLKYGCYEIVVIK